MKHTITRLAVSLLAGLTIALGAVATAGATETGAPATICADWAARGATGAYPQVVFGGKPAGTEISASSAKLVKPTEGVSPGVEFASFDLGVGPLAQEAIVHVAYATSGGASTSAGAIRMFAYYDKNADTLTTAPDHVAIAGAESGNLLFTVPAGKKIGTLGLVFDASNNTAGAVTFTGLTVGERPVSFTACPEPTQSSSSASPSASTSTSSSPSPSASTSASTSPTTVQPTTTRPTTGATTAPPTENPDATCAQYETNAEAQAAYLLDPVGLAELDADQDGYACEYQPGGSSGGGLPLTGAPVFLIGALAFAAIGTGVLLFVLARRRKIGFTA